LGPSSIALGNEVAGALAESRERSARSVTLELVADAIERPSVRLFASVHKLIAHRDPFGELVEHVELHGNRERRVFLIERLFQYVHREYINAYDQSGVFRGHRPVGEALAGDAVAGVDSGHY
jgi:hypothetical protein